MPGLALKARFLLHTFQGHDPGGKPTAIPDNARVFSALVNAAGKGLSAVEVNGDLQPNPMSRKALEWLERQRPTQLAIPNVYPTTNIPVTTYRDQGVLEKGISAKKNGVTQFNGWVIPGEIAWWFPHAPADEIVAALDELAADVGYLGEAYSPVSIEVVVTDDFEVTHQLAARQDGVTIGSSGGVRLATPIHGRLSELDQNYRRNRTAKRPTLAADRAGGNQKPAATHTDLRTCVRELIYERVEARSEPCAAPWQYGFALQIGGTMSQALSVPWMVAFHRAIVRHSGAGVHPAISGKYPDGVVPPPNRIALHLVRQEWLNADRSGWLVAALIPRQCEALAQEQLHQALERINYLRCRGTTNRVFGGVQQFDAEHFWSPPQAGFERWWRPTPGLVPELRSTRGSSTRRTWSFEDCAKIAVAHVFRDDFDYVGRKLTPQETIDAATAAGVGVRDVHRIPHAHVERFAHRLKEGVVVEPYTAQISISRLAPDTALMALGQSRHLGGGLLLPCDTPAFASESDEG